MNKNGKKEEKKTIQTKIKELGISIFCVKLVMIRILNENDRSERIHEKKIKHLPEYCPLLLGPSCRNRINCVSIQGFFQASGNII